MITNFILGYESFATKITSMRSTVCVDSFMTYQHIWFLKYLETKCTFKIEVDNYSLVKTTAFQRTDRESVKNFIRASTDRQQTHPVRGNAGS